MLESPRDAHYGYAENQAEKHVHKRRLPPPEEHPEKVHHYRQATGFIWLVHHFVAEWPKRIGPDLEKLNPKRDTDYGNAQQQPAQPVKDCRQQAAKDKPDDISDAVHGWWFLQR